MVVVRQLSYFALGTGRYGCEPRQVELVAQNSRAPVKCTPVNFSPPSFKYETNFKETDGSEE